MPEPIEKGTDGGTPPEDIEKLKGQIDNLNKGIATSREEAKAAREEARIAREEAAALRKNTDKDEDVVLTAEDEKKMELWAKKMGLVSKEEFETEKLRVFNESLQNVETQAVDEFLKAHPEYNTEEGWKKVKEEFELYKQPTTITGFRKLLKKIHKDLSGEDTKEEARSEARAEIQKRKILGAGGRHSPGAGDGDTVESLRAKYPNLSKDQIEARLAEISSLYPKK